MSKKTLLSKLKNIEEYQKENNLNRKQILEKLAKGDLEFFIDLINIDGMIFREKFGTFSPFIEKQNFHMAFSKKSYAYSVYKKVAELFGNNRMYHVKIDGLCKITATFFKNKEHEFLLRDNISLECALELIRGKIKIKCPTSSEFTEMDVTKNDGSFYFIPLVPTEQSKHSKGFSFKVYKDEKLSGQRMGTSPNNFITVPVNKLLVKNDEKYLTLKEVIPLFEKLDFTEIDIANLLFRSDYFYEPISYFITKNNEVKRLESVVDHSGKKWLNETTISARLLYGGTKEIDISDLRVKKNNQFYTNVNNDIVSQKEVERELIRFVKICCPLLSNRLQGRIVEENNNFGENYLSPETVASLLTTWFFLEKRFKLLQSNDSNLKKEIEQEERTKHLSILEALKKDLQIQVNSNQKISIDIFIKWIMNNCNNLPNLSQKFKEYYLSIYEGEHQTENKRNSLKNTFIVKTLLRLVYEALTNALDLNNLFPDSIIETDLSPQDYTSNSISYCDKIVKFADNFNPKNLKNLAIKYRTDAQNIFNYIVEHNLRWFVKIKEAKIYNTNGALTGFANGWPKLNHKEEEKITKALKLAPFYKLPKKDLIHNEVKNFRIALKNTGEANLLDNSNKWILQCVELPEELYFLSVHYSYFIQLPSGNNIKIILDDIVLPQIEASKLEKLLNSQKGEQNTIQKSKQNIFELSSCEFIPIQNKALKELLNCYGYNEILQLGANGSFKIYLNVELGNNLCIRERVLLIDEHGEKTSHPFPPKNTDKESAKALKERAQNLDKNGKILEYKYSTPATSGYEIIPKDKIKELISHSEVKISFFDIEDRHKKECTHVQRYLGLKEGACIENLICAQVVKVEDLYVKKDEILGFISAIKTGNNIPNDKKAYILRKAKTSNKGRKQKWEFIVEDEQLIASNIALIYLHYILKNAGKLLETASIYEKCHYPILRNLESSKCPNMKKLNSKEQIYKDRKKDMRGYITDARDEDCELINVINDYRTYIGDELKKEKNIPNSSFKIDSDFECSSTKDFILVVNKHINIVQRELNEIKDKKEQLKLQIAPFKNAKMKVSQNIERFLNGIKQDYPKIYSHFKKNLKHPSKTTTYQYTSNVTWELE